MSIDKKDDMREGSEDSMDSSPEPEAGPSNPEAQGQPKRKGGRKPVCFRIDILTTKPLVTNRSCSDLCYVRGA
jgi:hypothetical protein